MPRGRFERWSWQIHVVASISQRPYFQYLTANVFLIAPVKRVEILYLSTLYGHACFSLRLSLWQDSAVLEWRVSLWDCRPGPVDRCICPDCTRPMDTCVMTVSVSTLLTGEFICNCLYLNSLSNQSLAKRSFRKVVLADSYCGRSLAMRSISATYCKSVTNHACQEGRKSWLSLIGFRKSICARPCIIAPMVPSHPQAPDGNQPILIQLCKYRSDFTPFCQIYIRCK